MIIRDPDPQPVRYDDYDITFSNGLLMSFSVAKDLGDSVDFDTSPMAVQFHFAEKISPTDEEAKVPPEDITVLMQHVLTISHRTRTVTPATREERDLFKQALHSVSRTLQ